MKHSRFRASNVRGSLVVGDADCQCFNGRSPALFSLPLPLQCGHRDLVAKSVKGYLNVVKCLEDVRRKSIGRPLRTCGVDEVYKVVDLASAKLTSCCVEM